MQNTDEKEMKTEAELHAENLAYRSEMPKRRRIVVKVGTSSLIHPETGRMDYRKFDRLARELSDIKNQGKEVILVSSGATAVGREFMRNSGTHDLSDESPITVKQACAAVGQSRLMMIYQKSFSDYNQTTAQVLMTKNTITNILSKYNLHNTLSELLKLGVIPVINENDSVATYEYKVGDNDNLSAMIASLMNADLLVLLSDVDGLYTDDPHREKDARFIEYVDHITEEMAQMGKSTTGSAGGTGGMSTKISAAQIAVRSGCDVVIVNSGNMGVLNDVVGGQNVGTLFRADPDECFDLRDYVEENLD
jgi:glutamate 5-kinase